MNALDRFARQLLQSYGVRRRPAVDVELLVRRLGVQVQERRSPPGERGRVVVRGDRIVIVLQAGMLRGRRRFILCHELGHVICADPRLGALPLRQRLEVDEERFCDRLAEAILLPQPWLRGEFGNEEPSLVALFGCAQQAGVSVAAAAIALSRSAGWKRTLLRMQRSQGSWRLLSVTGELPVAPSSVRGGAALSRLLEEERFRAGRTQQLSVPLVVAGRTAHVGADVAIDGSRAFLLADLGSIPERMASGI